MADTKIKFSLFSVFEGEGFQKANKEIKGAADSGKKAMGVLGGLANEASKAEGALGKTAGAASSMIQGFAQMGIIGGVLAAVQAGVTIIGDHFKEQADKMVDAMSKAAEAAKTRWKDALTRHLKSVDDAMANTVKVAQGTVKEFNALVEATNKISKAQAQLDVARGTKGIADIQVEKLNAIIKEETDAGKALVAAKFDVMIAEKKAENIISADNEAHASAVAALSEAQSRKELLDEKVAAAREYLAKAESEEAVVRETDATAVAEFSKRRQQAEEILEKAIDEQTRAATEVQVAEVQLKQADIDSERARREAEAGILQSKIALDKVNEAEAKAAEAREKEAEAARKAAERLEAESQIEKIQADGSKQIQQADSDIADMKKTIKNIEDGVYRTRQGMDKDAQVTDGIFGMYQYDRDAFGNPDNYVDWKRAQRFAQRMDRDRATRDKADSAFQKKMQELSNKADKRGEQALSKREQEELKKWREYQAQKNGKAELQRKIEEKEKEKEQIRKKIQEDVKKIREDLKKALGVG